MRNEQPVTETREIPKAAFLIVCAFLSFMILTGARAADSDGDQTKPVTVNLAVYMLGGDLERDSAAASNDLNEMMRAQWKEGTAVFVATGGTEHWAFSNELDGSVCFSRVLDGRLEVVHRVQTPISDGETLRKYLDWCADERAADVTVLILWGHGMEGTEGIGTDLPAGGQSLTLQAIAGALEECRTPVDVIGMDACGMARADTVRELKNSCTFIVANEDREPITGWPYHHIAENITGDAEGIAKAIAACVNADRLRRGEPAGMRVIRTNGEE